MGRPRINGDVALSHVEHINEAANNALKYAKKAKTAYLHNDMAQAVQNFLEIETELAHIRYFVACILGGLEPHQRGYELARRD